MLHNYNYVFIMEEGGGAGGEGEEKGGRRANSGEEDKEEEEDGKENEGSEGGGGGGTGEGEDKVVEEAWRGRFSSEIDRTFYINQLGHNYPARIYDD